MIQALRVLPLLLLLAAASPGAAYTRVAQDSHHVSGLPAQADAGPVNTDPVAKGAGLAPGSVAVLPGEAHAGNKTASHEREDLTVFFSIGVLLDILLVTAFLVWAVRQWRKTK